MFAGLNYNDLVCPLGTKSITLPFLLPKLGNTLVLKSLETLFLCCFLEMAAFPEGDKSPQWSRTRHPQRRAAPVPWQLLISTSPLHS